MPLRFAAAITLAVLSPALAAAQPRPTDLARYQTEAARVTIVRDNWGIAHIHGVTDADAVFGTLYAQAEDDFNRVETNYLNSLGRLAEAEGPAALPSDLRQRLFIDPIELQAQYKASPPWLRDLMDAFADGLNFYLLNHPETHPRVLTHFEPWMALSFTEGSIGGDIERIDLPTLAAFYLPEEVSDTSASLSTAIPGEDPEPTGSNGIAIAPSDSATHHALLLINPHTSFFFRSELQMTSDAGLDAYGAVTWGQFFVYQGFNPHIGWMHTSSGVDAVDRYIETIVPIAPQPGASASASAAPRYIYKFGTGQRSNQRPVLAHTITLTYKTPTGPATRTVTTYSTQHGPVIGQVAGDKSHWITIHLMQRHIAALKQSFLRTKSQDFADYRRTLDLLANSSNNTILASTEGTIAYFHGNFIPRRDPHIDFTQPVDGSDPTTEWHGLLPVDETPHLINPASGYLFNVNNSPWQGAGASSLHRADFPPYVETGSESARGLHAIRLLAAQRNFTLESLLAAAYDSYLPWFESTLPALMAAYDALPPTDPRREALRNQVAALRTWDYRWSGKSVSTTLAVFWGEQLRATLAAEPSAAANAQRARAANLPPDIEAAAHAPAPVLLEALAAASQKLTADFGTWQTPWGTINRFQRLDDAILPTAQDFSDSKPSIAVPFTSSTWGSLASFGARAYPTPPGTSIPPTKKRYGTSGNSFVAVVEFGPRIHALAVTAGGESGSPQSPHFDDEATRYASGHLREVYFYPDQLIHHTERSYRPGQQRVPAVVAQR